MLFGDKHILEGLEAAEVDEAGDDEVDTPTSANLPPHDEQNFAPGLAGLLHLPHTSAMLSSLCIIIKQIIFKYTTTIIIKLYVFINYMDDV